MRFRFIGDACLFQPAASLPQPPGRRFDRRPIPGRRFHRYRRGTTKTTINPWFTYLLYADLFDTEGIISSPPKAGRKKDIIEVIDVYEKDFPKLKKYSKHYPTPEYLRSIAKQGATGPAPEAGFSKQTEGSKHIIECAHRDDPRPLYVLVWGSITDVAQALHDDPSIKEKIRVYFVASWNLQHDKNAFRYIDEKPFGRLDGILRPNLPGMVYGRRTRRRS